MMVAACQCRGVVDGMSADLTFALDLADEAGRIALEFFAKGVTPELKEDGSPVTVADFEVERRLLEMIDAVRPGDGVLSEEGGSREASGRRWLIDPIDGTVNFAQGSPHWGTHVALEVDDAVVLGVMTRPVMGQRWWATTEGGAFHADGTKDPAVLATSSVESLDEARVTMWPPRPGALLDRLQRLDGWSEPDWTTVPRLLRGELDVLITAGGGPWDHAPVIVLTEEAGGSFWDHDGGRRLDLGGGVFSNGAIDEALRDMLASLT
jgi:fructose-1,6-bisphosphatase/inositol monophosphatase family enzyme